MKNEFITRDMDAIDELIERDIQILQLKHEMITSILADADEILKFVFAPKELILSAELFEKFYNVSYEAPDYYDFTMYQWDDGPYHYKVGGSIFAMPDQYTKAVTLTRWTNSQMEQLNPDGKWIKV